MLDRFWLFPLFVMEALKKEKKRSLTGSQSALATFSRRLRGDTWWRVTFQLKLIPLTFVAFVLMTVLGYRLVSLQDQIFYYEHIAQDFQQRLQEKKKDLSFVRALMQETPLNSLEYLLNAPKMNRFAFGDRLKSLSRDMGFHEMSFSLMPQKKSVFKEDLCAFLTTVSISYRVGADSQLRKWMERLSSEFPCFFIPRRLTIERLLLQDGVLEGLVGTYVMDWVVFDEVSKKNAF
jgi:hypothetical protein